MALISYLYEPALHDLYLYEDHPISWSDPPGSLVVKRPYAYNPTSWLYGYRKSLQGLNAYYRTGTTWSGLSSYFENEASSPNTQWVVYNTYVPLKGIFVSSRLGFNSEHWVQSLVYRDPAYTYLPGPVFNPDGPLVASTNVRFIRHDDVVFDYSPSQVIWQYRKVDPAFGDFSAISGNSSLVYADVAAIELTFDLPVDPVKVVDVSTLAGQRGWMLDSNNKIIEIDFFGSGYARGGNPGDYTVRTLRSAPDPTAIQSSVVLFNHDSGSRLLVELEPPTSASAGDGVLGVVMSAVKGSNDFVGRVNPRAPYDKETVVVRDEDRASNAAVQYQQSLGIIYPQFVKAKYPRTSCASESSADSLRGSVEFLKGMVG